MPKRAAPAIFPQNLSENLRLARRSRRLAAGENAASRRICGFSDRFLAARRRAAVRGLHRLRGRRRSSLPAKVAVAQYFVCQIWYFLSIIARGIRPRNNPLRAEVGVTAAGNGGDRWGVVPGKVTLDRCNALYSPRSFSPRSNSVSRTSSRLLPPRLLGANSLRHVRTCVKNGWFTSAISAATGPPANLHCDRWSRGSHFEFHRRVS